MFGKNAIAKKVDDDGLELDVKEIFYTLQGEGPYAGKPSVFIRLAGCHLACTFCDTNFEQGTRYSIRWIFEEVERLWPHKIPGLIVITGGEPTRQEITPLCELLMSNGWMIQIETAGSFWRECMEFDEVEVVVSPKNGYVHPEVAGVAIAWKYIIDHEQERDTDGLPITDTQGRGKPRPLAKPVNDHYFKVWLSPMDRYNEAHNNLNVQLVGELALKYGYRAGVQMHKLFGLR